MSLTSVVGPIAAFDYAVYNPGEFKGQPAAVFQGLRTRLSRLNIIRSIPPKLLDDFVFVPFSMNVYTYYKPYYEDFGVIGCLLAFSVIGLIEGKLFYAAINGNRIAKFFFAYLSYPLMLSIYDDHYVTYNSAVVDLYLFIFAFGYFYIMKRLRLRIFRNPVRMASSPLIVVQE
jgi:oligosaccharide repeat unit polymerase